MNDLSAEDVAYFERCLRRQRDAVVQRIREELLNSQREDFAALAGRVHDAGEESVAELLMSMNLTLVDREVSELHDVEAALTRIRVGTFSECEDCGGDIGRARLEVYPTVRRCIEDQQRLERNYAGGRDLSPSL